jgi:class 3 adenylate cyclase
VDEGRYLASRIPAARFVELPGSDHLPFVGGQDEILDAIEQFLSESRDRPVPDRVLASVLTLRADGVGDMTELRRAFEREVGLYRGRSLEAPGGRLVASFDGPGRAVRCGRAMAVAAGRLGIPLRAGVHIGECDPSAPCGPVIDVSADVADRARAGEICVSRTVVDLVPGSGIQFAERGTLHVPDTGRELSVFAVAGP